VHSGSYDVRGFVGAFVTQNCKPQLAALAVGVYQRRVSPPRRRRMRNETLSAQMKRTATIISDAARPLFGSRDSDLDCRVALAEIDATRRSATEGRK